MDGRLGEVPLTALAPGEWGRIRSLREGPLRQRMLELGFGEDAVLLCLLRSPLGDPTAYRVRGVTVALRRQDAETVWVERLNPDGEVWP